MVVVPSVSLRLNVMVPGTSFSSLKVEVVMVAPFIASLNMAITGMFMAVLVALDAGMVELTTGAASETAVNSTTDERRMEKTLVEAVTCATLVSTGCARADAAAFR